MPSGRSRSSRYPAAIGVTEFTTSGCATAAISVPAISSAYESPATRTAAPSATSPVPAASQPRRLRSSAMPAGIARTT